MDGVRWHRTGRRRCVLRGLAAGAVDRRLTSCAVSKGSVDGDIPTRSGYRCIVPMGSRISDKDIVESIHAYPSGYSVTGFPGSPGRMIEGELMGRPAVGGLTLT
jgi:hypothetical protein